MSSGARQPSLHPRVALRALGCSLACLALLSAPHAAIGSESRSTTFHLFATHSTTLHNDDAWADRSLGDESWMMAGSDARGLLWFSVLRFPLDAMPAVLRPSSARILLPVRYDVSIPNGDDAMTLRIRPAVQSYDTGWTWRSPPRVHETDEVECTITGASAAQDTCDVTLLVQNAMERGDDTLTLVLIPSSGDVSFRRRWSTEESVGPVDAEGLAAMRLDALPAVPMLVIEQAAEPAAP
jgi:hypothetical protein